MSTIKLKLAAFAGAEIKDIIRDAIRVAERCGCWATIEINGIHVLVSPDDSEDALHSNYLKARVYGATYVSGNVVPNPPQPLAKPMPLDTVEGVGRK